MTATLIGMFLFTTTGFAKADAIQPEEAGIATKYLMNVQYVDAKTRDAYYAMPLSDLLDLLGAKLDKVENNCYEFSDACFEENKSYNILRSIYFNRLGETGPQVAVLFDQLTDAYFMCQQQEEKQPELCEYLHDMQNAVYEWAAPMYADDIVAYAWLIDELLVEEEEEPIYSNPATDELIQYALDRINEDRAKFDLPPVSLSANPAAQIHAEDVFGTRTISHWMTNGEKPYMTYSRLGGIGYAAQNVATWGDMQYYRDCTSGFYDCEITDPYKEIDLAQYGMMYDDEECCDNGHRDNILDPYHTHVSIGIAYDEYFFVIVQNFEGHYITWSNDIDQEDVEAGMVSMYGTFKNNIDALSGNDVALYAIYILYDPLPTPHEYQENYDEISYGYGEFIAEVVEPADEGYYYEEPSDYTLIEAGYWQITETGFNILFRLDSLAEKHGDGVYTITIWCNDPNQEAFVAAEKSLFVG